MNRFRFRLESVLRLRAAREEEKKREFGVSLGHLKQEEQRFDEITRSINDLDRYRTEKGTGRISVAQMIRNFFFSSHLHTQKDEQQKKVGKAQEIVDEKRTEMTEATKQRKTLERLKERKRIQYDEDVRREEQSLIDEIATQHFPGNGRSR
jgi:flagellar FliJ protein